MTAGPRAAFADGTLPDPAHVVAHSSARALDGCLPGLASREAASGRSLLPQQLAQAFPRARYQSVTSGICERLDLECLDLLAAFRGAYRGHESLFISYDGDHPNERGHALIGAAVASSLAREAPVHAGAAKPVGQAPARASDG